MLPALDHLLARLRDPNDRVASGEFAEIVFPWLVTQLQLEYRDADEHLLYDAARETVIGLIQRPEIFDPIRSSLPTYLLLSAKGDYKNGRDREARHSPKLRVFVELDEIERKECLEGHRWEDHPELEAVCDGLEPTDRAVFDLMRDGAPTSEIAAVLMVTHLADDEQQRAVKRAKDRILKRFIRAGGKS